MENSYNVHASEIVMLGFEIVRHLVASEDDLKNVQIVAGLEADDWEMSPTTIYGDIGPFIVVPASNAIKRDATLLLNRMVTDDVISSYYCGNIVLDSRSGRKVDPFIGSWKKQVLNSYKDSIPESFKIDPDDEAGPPKVVIEPLLIWKKAYNLRDLSGKRFTKDEITDGGLNRQAAHEAWQNSANELYDMLIAINRRINATYTGDAFSGIVSYSY